MRTTFTLACAVIAALTLGACSKHNSKSLKAQAEVAKAKNSPDDQRKVYDRAEEAIDGHIAKLRELGVSSMDKGILGTITSSFFGNVKPEDREEVKKQLDKIKEDAETQIGLAKELNDADRQSHAETTKKNAEKCLQTLAEQ